MKRPLILAESDPYFYFIFKPEASHDSIQYFANTTDRKAIVDSKINDLIVVDMSHSTAATITDLKEEFDEAFHQIFLDRFGYTIIADEEDFPQLFIKRISNENRGYNITPKTNFCPYSAVSFRLRPQLCINTYSFHSEKVTAEIAGYVRRHNRLDLKSHTDDLREKDQNHHYHPNYEYTNLRNNLRRQILFFNARGIFIRLNTLELIYDPKKAARQEIVRKRRIVTLEQKKETVSPKKLTHGEVRSFYWGLRSIAELALLGEDFSESNLSRSIFQTARRSMAFINLIDAVFTGKPYRYLDSFVLIREHFKTIPKEKHGDYPRRFVEFFIDEIARHPKPPRKQYSRWDIRRESFIYPYYRKKFKYVRDMKFPVSQYDPNA